MPITFDIENDALVKIGIDRERRKIIEAMLEEGSLSIKQVSSIMHVQENDIVQIQIELTKNKKNKKA